MALKWQILWETNKFQVAFSVLHLSMWDFSSSKKKRATYSEQQRRRSACANAQISLRECADWSAPLLFAHILRWVFSATLAINQAQVALLLYGQLFNGVLIHTHWNIGSTFVRRWIRNWIVVKVTLSKTVRGNEEWQIESVIKKMLMLYIMAMNNSIYNMLYTLFLP